MNNYNSANNYYNRELRDVGRKLRKNMTKAETALWKYALRAKQRRGYTFNRQRPILDYVADFMCKKLKLIIEVDGSSHESPEAQEYDKKRQSRLESCGYTVLRFTNEDVLKNMDSVCTRIDEEIALLEEL